MSLAIEVCTGKVHVFKQGEGSAGVGAYALDPAIEVGEGSKCLLMGAPVELREIATPVVTLNDLRILYAFGAAWTTGAVQGKLLLGDNNSIDGALGSLQRWYASNRLSELMGPVSLSVGSEASEVFIVGLSLGLANGEFNTQDFTINLMMAKE